MEREELILVVISVIIIFCFAIYVFYLIITSRFASRAGARGLTGGQFCQIGECASNLTTGQKRCPVPTARIQTLTNEVCNAKFLCNNLQAPFAIQNDGSTDYLGVCPEGVICGCLPEPRCNDNTVVIFGATDGNAFQNTAQQRLTFTQEADVYPPIQLKNLSQSFCALPSQFFSLATPGCNFGTALTCADYQVCFGLQSGCQGVTSEICNQGTAAIITQDASSWVYPTDGNFQLGCFSADPCPCDSFPLYDTNLGRIFCKQNPCS